MKLELPKEGLSLHYKNNIIFNDDGTVETIKNQSPDNNNLVLPKSTIVPDAKGEQRNTKQ